MTKETPIKGSMGEVVIYRTPDGRAQLDVRLEGDTLWLAQKQMSELFDTERSVITKHLQNIFRTGELGRESVCAKFAHTAEDGKTYKTAFYNLDAIISVGYRVNSKRGTQFRVWATRVLRDHLLKGYSVNERRLKEINQAIRLIGHVAERREFTGDEASALLKVAADYSYALDLLDDYDNRRVTPRDVSEESAAPLEYEEALAMIDGLRKKFGASSLFGTEKDRGLDAALGAVVQSFGGRDLYPSLEEKAANLIYFLVKNHPFTDGNKRIGAALFLRFMEKNGALYRADGSKRIADNALVAMTLLIAESRPSERDIITAMTVNLINRKN